MGTNTKKIGNSFKILGIPIVSTSIEKVLAKIDEIVHSSLKRLPFLIVTVGPEFIMMAQKDMDFARIIAAADLPLPDGVGIRWGLKNSVQIIPGRKLVSELVKKNYRIFYLGGRDNVAAAMAAKYGGAWDEGEQNVRQGFIDNERIIDKINDYAPDVLLVAYGAPHQEKWLWSNRSRIKAKVVMGVGGSFDYLAGKVRLPPVWVEKIELEWLWRLIHQPWRWRRQLRLVEFAVRLFFSPFFSFRAK